jgi:cysteine desulfurase
LQYGGGQERGLRSGTENIAACVGFATALEATQAIKHNESTRLAELQSRLLGLLDGCALNGGSKKRLPNNLNIRFQGIDNERVVFELDSLGFMVSSGSACHAKSGSPSRVLESIGLDTTEANSSLRITMGRHTTLDDVDKLATTLLQLVAKNR